MSPPQQHISGGDLGAGQWRCVSSLNPPYGHRISGVRMVNVRVSASTFRIKSSYDHPSQDAISPPDDDALEVSNDFC